MEVRETKKKNCDGFYSVSCLLSFAPLDCCVGFYGEKHEPCQTRSCTGNKKEKESEREACAGMGQREGGLKFDSKNLEGVGSYRETEQAEIKQQLNPNEGKGSEFLCTAEILPTDLGTGVL